MEVFEDKDAMRAWTRRHKAQGRSVGLVPTMGFLHEGHFSLVAVAGALCDVVVVSIYVNPTQFGPNEDLDKYPRDVAGDLKKLEARHVAAVFCPKDLYRREQGPWGGPHQTWVTVEHLELPLCGRGRPGHFRGVATVVAKLFNIVEPDTAVFGKKDFQQFSLISQMVSDLDFPVRVVGAPLLREPDGLALSSRNVRLSPGERQKALSISQALFEAEAMLQEMVNSGMGEGDGLRGTDEILKVVHERITSAGGRVEYAELVDAQTLQPPRDLRRPSVLAVAAFFGNVRLIDNIEMNSKEGPARG